MHEVGFSFDLNFITQLILTFLFLSISILYFIKSTAAKYFEIGGPGDFETYNPRDYMISDSSECSVCGELATKKCQSCKSVRYCSQVCQSSDWKSGHKSICKSFSPSRKDGFNFKASLFGNKSSSKTALVPRNKPILKLREVLFPYEDFVHYFNWDRRIPAPCGLVNCGNSCFANVVLQCLSWTRPLVAYILEKGHKQECNRNDWCFFCEFESHLERSNRSRFPFSPMNIISRLPNIGGNLGYGRQEDAHELMRFAIDMMQSVCLDEFGGEKIVPPRTQETTLIQYTFGGLLQSQVKCSVCSNVSNQYENIMDLTVEIHGDAASLEECLDQYTAKEWLQGDNLYKCDRCDDYVKACKRLSIRCAPNILTIALKRFQGGRYGKLNKRVSFPETFDLGPYMTEEGGEGGDVYKLYGVIVHLDMLNASYYGHYICYVKDFCGNWYRIDDSDVEKVELEDVLSQRAYMLLYSRVQTRRSSLRSGQVEDEKEKDTLKTESRQDDGSDESSVGENGISVSSSSSLCNGVISHSEEVECEKESPPPPSFSITVSDEENEVFSTVDDKVESESNTTIVVEHDFGTEHRQEEEANVREDPTVEYSCLDITTSPATEPEQSLEKEDSDTEMIDVE